MKTQHQFFWNQGFPSFVFTVVLAFLFSGPLFGQHFFEILDDPFGLGLSNPPGGVMLPTLVDIDDDGDLDLFVAQVWGITGSGCFSNKSLDYYENISNDLECPVFEYIGPYPFGIPEEVTLVTFVDINGDGAKDLFSSTFCGNLNNQFLYCQNTGTATEPNFGEIPIEYNPFNLDPSNVMIANLVFCDMDSSGTFDVFINGRTGGLTGDYFLYQKNKGTPTNPDFEGREIDPFMLDIPTPAQGPVWAAIDDWDCDGDLDILNCHWNVDLGPNMFKVYYYENQFDQDGFLSFKAGVLLEDEGLIFTHGDLDGDGDEDIMAGSEYARNVTTECVTLPPPEASFTGNPDKLSVAFANTSEVFDPECNPALYYWDFGDGTTSAEENPTHIFPDYGEYMVCLTVEDVGGIKDDTCKMVLLINDVRERASQDAISLYPNPATDYLELALDTGQALSDLSLSIYDAHGRLVWQAQVDILGNETTEQIDVRNLPDGLYALRLMQEGMVVGKMFVVMRE